MIGSESLNGLVITASCRIVLANFYIELPHKEGLVETSPVLLFNFTIKTT